MELTPGRLIGPHHPTFIIAEIGQNHQGNLEYAKELINAAQLAGADCVKFQKTSLPDKFTKFALAKPYKSLHSWGNTYGEHKKCLEFSEEQFRTLQKHAENRKVAFTASAKDIISLNYLLGIDVPFVKIGSGDSDDFLLLHEAAKCGKPLVISTGMQDTKTVHKVYQTVKGYHKNFALLHCVSSYPTNPEDVNLKIIRKYQDEFPDINIGYSGHELGTVISVAAVALGARIIERHITLNKNNKGNDHACSLLPEEFQSMVADIRTVEKALGDNCKRLMQCELPCYEKLGKSLVAANDLTRGTVIKKSDIKIKVSYPKGIASTEYEQVIGTELKQSLLADEPLQRNHLL